MVVMLCPDCGSPLIDFAFNFEPSLRRGPRDGDEPMVCDACGSEFALADVAFTEATPA